MDICKKRNSLCCRVGKKELDFSCAPQKGLPEASQTSASKYTCLYLLDRSHKCAFIYGCGNEFPKNFKDQIKKSALHVNSHKKAFENQKISYEWFLDGSKKKPELYRTMLVPLGEENGEVDKILGIVRKVNDKPETQNLSYSVAEGEAPSMVRLLMNNREAEKKKITSLLHDEIGSAAVAINSLLSILKEDIKDGKKAQALKDADKLQKAVASSMERMKKAIINLRPPQLDDVGLDAALRHLVDGVAESSSLEIDYRYKIEEEVKLSEDVKTVLFRTVQEALNNVVKHSKADKVKISLKQDADKILLLVEDNGIGYEEEGSKSADKLGILGMKENISYIGGSMAIEGKRGKGTKIKVVCPIISYKRFL